MEPAPNVVQPAHQTRTAVRSGVVSPPASFPKDGPCLTGDPVIDNTKFALSSLSSHDRMIRMIEDVTAASPPTKDLLHTNGSPIEQNEIDAIANSDEEPSPPKISPTPQIISFTDETYESQEAAEARVAKKQAGTRKQSPIVFKERMTQHSAAAFKLKFKGRSVAEWVSGTIASHRVFDQEKWNTPENTKMNNNKPVSLPSFAFERLTPLFNDQMFQHLKVPSSLTVFDTQTRKNISKRGLRPIKLYTGADLCKTVLGWMGDPNKEDQAEWGVEFVRDILLLKTQKDEADKAVTAAIEKKKTADAKKDKEKADQRSFILNSAEAKNNAAGNKTNNNKKKQASKAKPMTSAASFRAVNDTQANLLKVQATEAKLNGQSKRKVKEQAAKTEHNEKKIRLYIARKDAEAKRALDAEAMRIRALEAEAKKIDAEAHAAAATQAAEAAKAQAANSVALASLIQRLAEKIN